ncbi:fumarate hydratase [Candidatus Peregrinibacteria bacterium]|nr:MAG: fumarate hydratase [Candidatus Peregrinibacteria bacterium]
MRTIPASDIFLAAEKLIQSANFVLPEEIQKKIRKAEGEEENASAKLALQTIIQNAKQASERQLPLCQDTGTAVFFVEIGMGVVLEEPIFETLKRAVSESYTKYRLRASIVFDPLFDRRNTKDNTPPLLHLEQVLGENIRITFLPKGGGAENKSTLTMLRPADGEEGVVKTVLETAKKAGGTSCPPWILGIGIGGTFDSVAVLAKRALFCPSKDVDSDARYTALEKRITREVNALKIGTMGFGGNTTVLSTHIEYAPTHMASLPVAINIQCHSARSAEILL